MSIDKFGGYKTEVREEIKLMEMLAFGFTMKEEKHLQKIGGVRDYSVQTTSTAQWQGRES